MSKLSDARQRCALDLLTVEHVPATSPQLETAGGDLTAAKIAALFAKWPEAVGSAKKWTSSGRDGRRAQAMPFSRNTATRLSGFRHVYGREFVAAYGASGVTDTHERDRSPRSPTRLAGSRRLAVLRGGPPTTPWHIACRKRSRPSPNRRSTNALRFVRRPAIP